MEIKEAQQLAWQNKIAKGFNTSDVLLEFMLLHSEVAESFQAWRRAQPDLGEELADVALYLFALAEMNGVDLNDEIEQKITTHQNSSRGADTSLPKFEEPSSSFAPPQACLLSAPN